MTQQINLYIRPAEAKKGPVLFTMLAIAAAAILCVVYAEYLRGENRKLEQQVARAKAELSGQETALSAMKAELAKRTDPARLAAELAAVKARASEAQVFLAMLDKGDLGTMEGYGAQLVGLAQVSEPGVWLTGVRISSAGKSLELEGRALSAESVLRYAGQVNRHFASKGTSLTTVELAPSVVADKAAIAFKLR